mgnify:CR=1 FL=1
MFRLPKRADQWFSNIRPQLKIDFDLYYFCLMAGLAKGVKESLPQSETRELIRTFPNEYRSESKIIVAYFLTKELEKLGVSLDDRAIVHSTIKRYIDSESPSAILSEEGQRELNNYANAGLDVLIEEFNEDKPQHIETFLPRFCRLISRLES